MFDQKDFSYWVDKTNENPNDIESHVDAFADKNDLTKEERAAKHRGFQAQPLKKIGWKFVDPNKRAVPLGEEDELDYEYEEDYYED